MAGKKKFTAAEVAEALEKAHGIRLHAAKILDCSPSTITNYINEYVTVEKAATKARTHLIEALEDTLYTKALDGDNTCLIFALKCQGKDRGWTERTEVTGADGNEITIKVVRAENHAGNQPQPITPSTEPSLHIH